MTEFSMNCGFSEKVSLLIDGELAPAESEQVKAHLTTCLDCRQMERDFLGLRDQIRSYDLETEPLAHQQALSKVLASRRVPLWQRHVTLPAPVFALVVMAVLVIVTWALISRGLRQPASDLRVTKLPAQTTESRRGGIDLSTYDHGERAVIYKMRRSH
jgi:anti-sigma factor RsiW